MSESHVIKVPDIGDFDAVDVVEVLVAAGDVVAVDDSLITLESDKATMDIPATHPGKVREIKVKAGDKIQEGAVILVLDALAAAVTEEESPADESAAENAAENTTESPAEAESASEEHASTRAAVEPPPPAPASPARAPQVIDERAFSRAYASPSVRRFARELGVDLGKIRGTGRKDRILKEDVQAFVKKVMSGEAPGGGFSLPDMPVIDFSKFGPVERQPLSRIKKIAAANLHRSWLHVPHVTQNDNADVTEMEAFRQKHKAEAKANGYSLTPLTFIMKAVVAALKRFPQVNSSLDPDGEHLIYKSYYHLGVAVDTPEGLVVPVIRDVDQKGIFDLAEELGTVSAAARERKLTPDMIRGASFTISSLGGIGGAHFSPIVNAPEVAILGVGRSEMQPVWDGAEFEPRLILPLSLSYDHRVIDGALGVRFTTYLSELLADVRRLLL